jgi:circadian clock protein KaiC
MVDGLFELSTKRIGMRTLREIEVLKLRGSDNVLGGHFFEITNAGITIHPRTEALLGRGVGTRSAPGGSLSLGNEQLDDLFAGDLTPGSASLVLGPPGTGKTLLGLQFLCSGAERKEAGLCFGFFEDAPSLLAKARRTGLWPRKAADQTLVELAWQPPAEQIADALVNRLLSMIKARNVRRLFIDGWAGFEDALIYPQRGDPFFTALIDELRTLGVTTFISKETAESSVPLPSLSIGNLAATVDNVVLLRRLEAGGRVARFISLLKVRQGAHDSSLREFSIGNGAVQITGTFRSAQAAMTGSRRSGKKDRGRARPRGKRK